MHVTEVEFVGLRTDLPTPAVFSWGAAAQRNIGLVRVRTAEGVTGWGETSVTFPLWSLEERAATVRGIAPLLAGLEVESAADIDAAVLAARAKTDRLRLLWSHVAISAALGAIEMALWDAWGRSNDKPVWQMLGGEDLAVPLYAVGFGGRPADVAARAADAIADGFSAVKIRVGFDPEADVALTRAVTERVGGDAVLVDANMGWTRAEAAAMIPRIEPFRPQWLEEPLSRDDWEGYRQVRDATGLALAAGENCFSVEELTRLAASGLVDVIMPDAARVGGLTAAVTAARVAPAGGYSPHHYASDIGFCAALALCAVVGAPRPLLRDLSAWPIRDGILSDPVAVTAGCAHPYAGPGLSPQPRPEVIREHQVL